MQEKVIQRYERRRDLITWIHILIVALTFSVTELLTPVYDIWLMVAMGIAIIVSLYFWSQLFCKWSQKIERNLPRKPIKGVIFDIATQDEAIKRDLMRCPRKGMSIVSFGIEKPFPYARKGRLLRLIRRIRKLPDPSGDYFSLDVNLSDEKVRGLKEGDEVEVEIRFKRKETPDGVS